ncbi:MAG: hypothetical protein JWL62_2023, partial [Hyphomicrobiales bacterium]|nr:hypothetical protein [Hyphomicrobiales bacterium]
MRRLFYAIAAFVFLQGVTLLSASAADPPARGAKWSCECETYGGSKDNCYMYADINGKVFDFGAFETS